MESILHACMPLFLLSNCDFACCDLSGIEFNLMVRCCMHFKCSFITLVVSFGFCVFGIAKFWDGRIWISLCHFGYKAQLVCSVILNYITMTKCKRKLGKIWQEWDNYRNRVFKGFNVLHFISSSDGISPQN